MTGIGAAALAWAIAIGFATLLLSFALLFVRVVKGPTLPDRIVALDLLTVIATAFTLLLAISNDVRAFLDVAIALGLVAFLSTIAFARYVLVRGLSRTGEAREGEDRPAKGPAGGTP